MKAKHKQSIKHVNQKHKTKQAKSRSTQIIMKAAESRQSARFRRRCPGGLRPCRRGRHFRQRPCRRRRRERCRVCLFSTRTTRCAASRWNIQRHQIVRDIRERPSEHTDHKCLYVCIHAHTYRCVTRAYIPTPRSYDCYVIGCLHVFLSADFLWTYVYIQHTAHTHVYTYIHAYTHAYMHAYKQMRSVFIVHFMLTVTPGYGE